MPAIDELEASANTLKSVGDAVVAKVNDLKNQNPPSDLDPRIQAVKAILDNTITQLNQAIA